MKKAIKQPGRDIYCPLVGRKDRRYFLCIFIIVLCYKPKRSAFRNLKSAENCGRDDFLKFQYSVQNFKSFEEVFKIVLSKKENTRVRLFST